MAINLLCLTSTGGVPIFSKKKGDCENLPFSTAASLHGIDLYCNMQGVQIQFTKTADWLLLWCNYGNSINIVSAAKSVTKKTLQSLTDLVFHSLALFINTEDLNYPNRIKRQAKNYMPIIDKLLDTYDSELLEFSDCILTRENSDILLRLNDFGNQVGSLFGAVVIGQKIAVATEGWWNLNVIEQKLLTTFLNSSNTTQLDVPVFLPKKDPNVAYRFVAIPLTSNIAVCVICGAEPSHQDIQELAHQIFKNDFELLQSAERCILRNFPNYLDIDQSILGILLIQKNLKKYIISRNLHQSMGGKASVSGSHRLDILRIFYNQAVNSIGEFLRTPLSTDNRQKSEPIESYWCTEYHKCHSYSDRDDTFICILYLASIPSHIMRLITKKTFADILKEERLICW